ncbi:MAG: toprim domain-containing protein [Candidatus Aenigmarchaeota archaeon]|nr:toprim domain-containing protein [Candidatus Aenigmarchaeota archaeon]
MLIPHNPERLIGILRESSIIVEGKRDKEALEKLGIEDIFDISGKSLEELSKILDKNKKYIILTDFDSEGNKKNKIISKIFEKNKIVFDPRLRWLFKKIFGITKVEEFIKISRLKEDVYHGKISTINYKVFDRSRVLRKWVSRKTRRDWGNIWAD